MGVLVSRLLGLFGEQEARILVLGLDNAGKTTILYRLQARPRPTRTSRPPPSSPKASPADVPGRAIRGRSVCTVLCCAPTGISEHATAVQLSAAVPQRLRRLAWLPTSTSGVLSATQKSPRRAPLTAPRSRVCEQRSTSRRGAANQAGPGTATRAGWRGGVDHPYDRIQRRDCDLQKHQIPGLRPASSGSPHLLPHRLVGQ